MTALRKDLLQEIRGVMADGSRTDRLLVLYPDQTLGITDTHQWSDGTALHYVTIPVGGSLEDAEELIDELLASTPGKPAREWDQARSCWADEPVTDGMEWVRFHEDKVG